MRPAAQFVMFVLVCSQLLASGATVDRFADGAAELVIDLDGEPFSGTVYFSIPAECHVRSATLKVTGADAAGPYPAEPEVLFNGTPIWSFKGAGFGKFGIQDRFGNGTDRVVARFGVNGGACNSSVRLPKGAQIVHASADIGVEGPRRVFELMNITGGAAGAQLGSAVSGVGDLNRDGYGDFAVASPGDSPGSPGTACVLVYLGGPSVDNIMDYNLKGFYQGGTIGDRLSGAGDVNGDGYDDLIAGGTYGSGYAMVFHGGDQVMGDSDLIPQGYGPYASGAGDVNGDGFHDIIVGLPSYGTGQACIFFGGRSSYTNPDITLYAPATGDLFGNSVSTAGDINADGYDDVIIGAYYDDAGGSNAGAAYVFLGGTTMDTDADVALKGTGADHWFGRCVSNAGDVNADGYDDVIVGSEYDDAAGSYAGTASIFLGGRPMDSNPDIVLKGLRNGDMLGGSVSDAGDVDNDGFDDVIAGARYGDGDVADTGTALVYHGGANMDAICDEMFSGTYATEKFGSVVSSAGDVDNDECDEVLVGVPDAAIGGVRYGQAHIYSMPAGPRDSAVSIGAVSVWDRSGFYNGTARLADFSSALAAKLKLLPATGNDSFGNSYVDLSVDLSAKTEGNITLSNLSITYRSNATTLDFSGPLNDYMAAHRTEKDASGRISIPIQVRCASPGKLKLHSLRIECDVAPEMLQPIPELGMEEDTVAAELLDLRDHFTDDRDPSTSLSFSIKTIAPADIIDVTVLEGHFLCADALSGSLNDNWTGCVNVTVSCADSYGSAGLSNTFSIVVRNVNDPPAITSAPPTGCLAGNVYQYIPAAVDGDGDMIKFGLRKFPENMTISKDGEIQWSPFRRGAYPVSIEASDGVARSYQDYVITVPDQPPKIISVPRTNATVGLAYEYQLIATDDDGDALAFNLAKGPAGMAVSPEGKVSWLPAENGTFVVSLAVNDVEAAVFQNYTITVNRPPRFIGQPLSDAVAGASYSYRAEAVDDDQDTVRFTLISKPANMSLDATTGMILWRPNHAQVGNHTVKIAADDGRGGVAETAFVVTVRPARPVCSISSPANGTKAAGKISIEGLIARGSGTKLEVKIRIDGGEWQSIPGNESWSFRLDTVKLGNGVHTIEARAFDGLSYSDSVGLSVIVDNPASGSTGGNMPTVAGIAVLVVLATVGAAYWSRSRKRPRVGR